MKMDNSIKDIQNCDFAEKQNDALVTFLTHHIAPILNENELLKMKIYRLEFYFDCTLINKRFFCAKDLTDLAKKFVDIMHYDGDISVIVYECIDYYFARNGKDMLETENWDIFIRDNKKLVVDATLRLLEKGGNETFYVGEVGNIY